MPFSSFIFGRVVQKQSIGDVLRKKMFLNISQNSQENTCASVSFLIKLRACSLQNYLKRDSGTGVFLLNFAKIFKSTCFEEHLRTSASGCRMANDVENEPQRFTALDLSCLHSHLCSQFLSLIYLRFFKDICFGFVETKLTNGTVWRTSAGSKI